MNGLIAVIGLSARFPGAPTADDLWKLVLEGREGLVRYEPDALAATVPRALRTHPGFVPVGSDLGDIELFDAAAFGMGAHEAIHLDPAHRLFLEQAWLALDASGYGHGIGVDQVGVYAGTSQSGYLHTNLAHRFDALGGADPVSALTCAIGTAPDYLAMGTAYRLGLRGAAVTVQTACSTSLVAVHQAVSALLSGETDLALAGGSTVHVPRGQGYLHVPDGPFSHDGHTRSYGAGAGGAVFTQGVGVVVLKRLDDAIDDGDHIHAVVRGSATNNDGSDKAGFTAPSVIGQARVIAEAHAVAGVQPVDIGLIEGHGTGTLLGDPIEVRALSTVFGEVTTPWCALGSIKSNIGHTEAAAGIAGFIKAVLAVENGVLPRTLHAEEPNPALDLTRSAFAIANETRPWSDSARPRIAGVSSFGFGGTNAHVVVEQPPHRPRFERDRAIRPCVLTVTGASAASATTHADRIVASLPDHDVRDVAFTLTHGRARLSYRTATVVDPDGRELIDRVQPVPSSGPAPAVVFAFPGGGSQFPGMLAETYRTDPESRELIDTLAHEFADLTGRDLRAVCAPQECGLPADDGVRPAQGLPALFTACLVVARRLASVGVAPDVLVGHSLGEYVAAVVSGALGLRDAVRIVAARAVALEDVDAGAMLRVRRTADELIELLTGHPDVEIAALDAPRSTLLSGPVAAIDEVAAAAGDDASVIPVAAAGHSKLVDPALPTVRSAATGIVAAAPTIPVFSSATGRRLTASEVADPEHWVRHMRHPVRFSDALSAAVAEAGQQRDVVVVNVGPGAATASLTRAHRFESVRATVTSLTADGASSPLRCAAELAVHGVELSPPNGRRTRLPDYPFDRSRYWVEPDDRAGARPDSARWFTGRWTAAPAQPSAPDAIADAAVQVIGAGEFADRLRDRIGCAACVDPSTAAVLVWPVDPDTTATTAGRLAALTRTMVDRGARPVVVQVTVGAEIVAPGDVGDPRQCAARGYGRVLSQEVPGVEVCAVDVESTADAPEAIATIVGDRRGTAWSEYAWRSGIRYTRRYDESERQEAESVGYDVVLIVGGLGRLGAAIGTRLAAGGVRVVCTTRGPLADDRARDAAAHPSGLVDVVRLDPTDSVESAALLRRLHRDHGAVAVVHAAGTVGPEAFAELGSGDDDSHEVKAAVTRALIAAVDALATAERPHSVTVMSSLASIVGGYGLGAYAAVNRVVETLVADRARRDGSTRWLAIQWDGWSTLDTWRPAERSADAFTRRLLADALDPGDAVDSLVGALGSVDLSAPRGVLAVTRRDLRAPDPAVAVAVAVD
ncbi:type I polyketide synthase, partial [Gordonia sp. (in: high G+C Gram-positive bacteria)]|uniref:type I polyketide synthase n=1 Tax=Gordonia sp. (in: high G+C Gram-positive bacteria) TaxID=84139 RepID=UPI003C74E0B2